jgi:hypothetical protein
MRANSGFAKSLRSPLQWFGAILILLILASIALGPIVPEVHHPLSNVSMQGAHMIGLAMFSYAQDHGGIYPSGKSSTEVFQHLIDAGYVDDPSLFYSPLQPDGKVKATSKKLKPENVCWDVTTPLDFKSSDGLPVVFSTGYRIEYTPHGKATPLPGFKMSGIAVFYHSNNAWFRRDDLQSDHAVLDFISDDFKPDDKKYVQLTPDGPLP